MVILKKTDFKKEQISLSVTELGGKSLYGAKDYANLAVFDNVVGDCGLGAFSNMDLPKVLVGKIANAHLPIGDKYMGIGGSSSRKDVETMLQLVYLYFTDIRKDKQTFTTMIDSWKDTQGVGLHVLAHQRHPPQRRRRHQGQHDRADPEHGLSQENP